MCADRYRNFADLSASETEGKDYRIALVDRASEAVIIAPHGGTIEPMTSELARMIAADEYSYYCFEGVQVGRQGELHITSDRFDEPNGRDLVSRARFAVALHGRKDRDDPETTWLGSRDGQLIAAAQEALSAAGFGAVLMAGNLEGKAPRNICNGGTSGAGLQLELPRTLRDRLRDDPAESMRYVDAARSAIGWRISHQGPPASGLPR